MTTQSPSHKRSRRAFSETADPSSYVARKATEAVLLSLENWAAHDRVGSTVAALVGPPGLGKTFLLRVIESRLRDRAQVRGEAPDVLYLPYVGLPPMDLCAWVYGLLGRTPVPSAAVNESNSSLAELFRLADTRAGKRPFFLLIDDADSMPVETLHALVAELPGEDSPLRILMALNEDAKASRLLAGFDTLNPMISRLQSPMNERETSAYVGARMRWAGITESADRAFDSESNRRIFALSGGIPQEVHRVAAALLEQRDEALPGALNEKQMREDWMGRPIGDDS